MLQALLAERLKLAVHREWKEGPIYALVTGPDGAKMKPTPADFDPRRPPFPDWPSDRILTVRQESPDGFRSYSKWKGRDVFEAQKIDMRDLARVLSAYVDDPVVNQTGLEGYWQVMLDVPGGPNYKRQGTRPGRANAEPAPTTEAAIPSGANIVSSVQKLGLRLEKRKSPIEHLIVDHVEKVPMEN